MSFSSEETFNDAFDDFESSEIESEDSETIAPSQTWKIDFESGRLTSAIIDGMDAVMQMVNIVVQTERDRYYIYDEDFGVSADEIISSDLPPEVAADELAQDIADAIEQDDRVESVPSVEVDIVEGVATFEPVIELVADGTEDVFESEEY